MVTMKELPALRIVVMERGKKRYSFLLVLQKIHPKAPPVVYVLDRETILKYRGPKESTWDTNTSGQSRS